MMKMANRKCALLVLLLALFAGCRREDRGREGVNPAQTEQAPLASPRAGAESSDASQDGVANRPPRVTAIDVTPLAPSTGDTLKLAVTTVDPDENTVNLIYQWFKNDVLLIESSSSLQLTDLFKRGDKITAVVTPDDGQVRGGAARMDVTVGNAPPVITSSPTQSSFSNRTFTYGIQASDKDNDNLSYSLKSAPAGMTVQSSTGLVQWNVPTDHRGKMSATIVVSDGHGGEALQSFAFEINPEK
jgi:Putative Ig domain